MHRRNSLFFLLISILFCSCSHDFESIKNINALLSKKIIYNYDYSEYKLQNSPEQLNLTTQEQEIYDNYVGLTD